MFGEQQAIIPNFASYPTPNPNPNPNPNPLPPHSDSQYQNLHGVDTLQDQRAFELHKALPSQIEQTISAPHDQAGGTMGETPKMSTAMCSEGNIGFVSQHVVQDVLVATSALPFRCEVCNITCHTLDVLEIHKKGKKHLKNLQKSADSSLNAPKMLPPSLANETSVGELENKKYRILQNGGSTGTMITCNICNVICNNQDVFQTHIAGKKHSAKAIMLQTSANGNFDPMLDSSGVAQKKPETVQCELCKISCSSNEVLAMHMQGKKHLKKLKESGQISISSLTPIASVETQSIQPIVNQESNEGNIVNSNEANLVWCKVCGISCNTIEVLNSHMSGKKHQKNLEKSQKTIGPNPAPTTPPASTPKVIGPLQEDGKTLNPDGSSRKGKRAGSCEDVETKKQKMMQEGAAADAVRTCTLCNVVCNSPLVFEAHLAGQKHILMAVKQAATQSTGKES